MVVNFYVIIIHFIKDATTLDTIIDLVKKIFVVQDANEKLTIEGLDSC